MQSRSLHHHLCITHHCYTFFKWQSYDVPQGKRGSLRWFVPKDHAKCFEIVTWLEHELEKDRTEDVDIGDMTIPGVDVDIMVAQFSGVDGYLDRDTSEQLARSMFARFKEKISSRPPHEP